MSIKVLLACNSESELSLISEMLDEYEIITTGDGLDVLQIIGINRNIDLVILDLNLPNMNGFELLSLFKNRKGYDDLRVIVVSDSDAAEDEIKCLNLGAHDYIRKKLQMLSLQSRVNIQTDIIRRQRGLTDTDQMLRATYEKAPIGISIARSGLPIDKHSKNIIDMNAKFEQICGYTKEQISNSNRNYITHPDDLEEDLRQYQKLVSGEMDSYEMDKRYIKPDGSIVWVHMNVYALGLDDNNERKHVCMIRDITDQKNRASKTENELRVISTFIEHGQDTICLKDDEYRYIFINKSFPVFKCSDKNKLLGKTDFELLDTETATVCRKSDCKALAENKVVNTVEITDGRIYETRKFPVALSNCKVGVGAFFRDITVEYNQREMLNKIAETNKIITMCMLKTFSDVQEQLNFALNEAIKLTESKYGFIYFYDEATGRFDFNEWSDEVKKDCAITERSIDFSLKDTGLWGEVVRQRRPIIINDFNAPNLQKRGLPEGHIPLQNYMAIPIFENDKITAVVGFANKKSDYTENDIHAITVLMSGVWIAVKKREKEKETEVLLERTQSMFNNHEAVMMLVDPQTGQIIEFNNAAVQFYGYTRQELMGMRLQDIAVEREETVRANLLKALNNEQAFFTVAHRLKSGEVRMVDVFSSPIEYMNQKVLYPIVFDVTERETITRQNDYLVYHDHLTGLYNRRFFDEEFNRRYHNIGAYPLGVIWGDINGFKMYNDSFGHLQGDYALMEVADKMVQCLEKGDVLARVGGDEFAILISNTDEEKLRACLNKLEWAVNNGTSSALTISFGYGIQRKQMDTMDMLVKEAEAFMYNRKYYSSKSTRSNAVKVIMETLFAKSEREKYHSERVGLISEAIAKKLDLDQQTIDKVRVAGFLHDIGKIGIDERILNKMELLDKNEWEIMKLHSAKGADILQNTIEFQDIAECVLSHHERFDGTGYPNRLKGNKIPTVSRIISVADAYDAMTNDRSYRHKISHKAAVEEIKQCAGTFFDPEIVEVFVKMSLTDIKRLESGEKPVS